MTMGLIRSGEVGAPGVVDLAAAIQFVNAMGDVFRKAGVGGCQSEADGQVLALACAMRRQDPFVITARNHIMDGKLSKKADVMLADFNEAGGKHRWIKTGDDGVSASLELTYDGQTLVSDFAFTDAQAEGLVDRKGSRWKKGPKAIGQMLRARCASNGVRMICPAVVAGTYTPDEVEDMREVEPEAAVAKRGRPSKADQEARAAELRATAGGQAAPADPVIDTTAEPVKPTTSTTTAAPKAEAPPFEVPARPAPEVKEPAQVAAPAAKVDTVGEVLADADLKNIREEIAKICVDGGYSVADFNASLAQKNPPLPPLDQLPLEKAKEILTHLRAVVGKK